MRGRTSDSRAPRSARALLGVLLRQRGSSSLAFTTALVSAGLGWAPSEEIATAAQPSAAASEAAPSDGTLPPAAAAAVEPVSSEPRERTDDRWLYLDDLTKILEYASDPTLTLEYREGLLELAEEIAKKTAQMAAAEASPEAALLRAAIRGVRSDWPAPLPTLVYEFLIAEMEAERAVDPAVQTMGGRPSADPLRAPIPDWLTAHDPNGPLDPNRPALSELVSNRILYDTREPTAPLLAAIELKHNEESFGLLLKYALRDYVKVYGHSSSGHWDSPAVEALWFLRAYDPTDEARAKVQKALQSDIRQSQGEEPAASQAVERAKYLRSLLASWDFARGLSEPRRKAYQEYERRRWMAWALTRGPAPQRSLAAPRSKGAGSYARSAEASSLCPWPDGDEDFFLRNFESPASTIEEVRHSGPTGAFRQPDGTFRFSDDGLRRLEAVANSDSPWATEAARRLRLLKIQVGP